MAQLVDLYLDKLLASQDGLVASGTGRLILVGAGLLLVYEQEVTSLL